VIGKRKFELGDHLEFLRTESFPEFLHEISRPERFLPFCIPLRRLVDEREAAFFGGMTTDDVESIETAKIVNGTAFVGTHVSYSSGQSTLAEFNSALSASSYSNLYAGFSYMGSVQRNPSTGLEFVQVVLRSFKPNERTSNDITACFGADQCAVLKSFGMGPTGLANVIRIDCEILKP
jgi:hypothetical protein